MAAHSPETTRFLTEDRPRRSPDVGDVLSDHRKQTTEDEDILSTINNPWKRTLFGLLEQPSSSPGSFLIHVLITSLILTSAIVTVLETIPQFHSTSTRVWFGLETMLVSLFTVEYIARSLAWSSSWRSWFGWSTSFFGLIDLLAILPYYIEIMLQQDTSVFFASQYYECSDFLESSVHSAIIIHFCLICRTIEVMYLSVRRSQHALLAISFFVVMVLTVFSTLLYFSERGTWDDTLETFINSDGDPTQFSSIPAAAWFVLVTITTVGYGEITPRSFLGRLITIPLLVFGLLLIALPSFVLGREFSIVWEKMTADRHLNGGPNDDNFSHTPFRPLFATGHNPSLDARPRVSRSSLDSANGTADLSNLKLAQNQTELRKQIIELRSTVVAQGDMVRRLVDLLESERKGKGRVGEAGS